MGNGTLACEPIDSADTTCDGVDDDCDGTLDENCDFGPADCPQGSRVIKGTAGDDWLWGTIGRDCILGYGGDDVLWGLHGDDLLVGGWGDDTLVGWDGRDSLLGDRGDDSLFGDGGNDQLDGGEGNDLLLGGPGNDDVRGGACHDQLVALLGTDSLFGEEGSDRIVGGAPHRRDGGSGVDACNPGTSCELTGTAARFCADDDDCGAGKRCVRRAYVCVREADLVLTDPTCDGFDDDCDGRIDEDYASEATTCGSGSCAGTGMTSCVEGEVVDSCVPGGPSGGSDVSCDGVDDDCDGASDENYMSEVTSCGVGACTAAGQTACVSGGVQDSCMPGTPAPSDASCDSVDDDCDGLADEHYASEVTSCGMGACTAAGQTACVGGSIQDSCVPGTPGASDAVCDGIDEDCDGTADEHYASEATSCGVGACAATGATTCVGGSVEDSCMPGTPAESDASCDGIDDDCNEATDEDYAPVVTTCEIAGCLAQGATACTAGMEEDLCLSQGMCIAELDCDDTLDNDGDTFIDCNDADCNEAPNCQTQVFDLTIIGTANLWGAGHATPPGQGASTLPPGITLALGAGAVVTFPSATGTINTGSSNFTPEGRNGQTGAPSGAGLAGWNHSTRLLGMIGVFLSDAEPVDPPPARLSFPNAEFTELSPGLRQIFYIGNGQTTAGVLQRFIVPAGATRLFLGNADLCSSTRIGCFNDNTGSFQVHGEVAFDP